MSLRPAVPALAAALLALAACEQKSTPPPPAALTPGAASPVAPVASTGATDSTMTYAQLPAAMQDLLDCAGAYAAMGGIDTQSRSPDMKNPWFNKYLGVLSPAINMTGSASAMEAGTGATERAAYWKAQPKAAQAARSTACDASHPLTPSRF